MSSIKLWHAIYMEHEHIIGQLVTLNIDNSTQKSNFL